MYLGDARGGSTVKVSAEMDVDVVELWAMGDGQRIGDRVHFFSPVWGNKRKRRFIYSNEGYKW